MQTFHAAASCITPQIIKVALAGVLEEYRMLPAKAVMHPAQSCMLDSCSIQVKETNILELEGEWPGQTVYPLSSFPRTCAGIPLVEDVREPASRIQFKDADDRVLAEIVCLALPAGFKEN